MPPRVTGRMWHAAWLVMLVGLSALRGADAREVVGRGARAPTFTTHDLSGTTRTLPTSEANTIVLHFWATWCPYCRAEIPKLKQIAKQWPAREVQILAVSVDEDLRALEQFVKREQLPYPVIAEAQGHQQLADRYQVRGIPTTFLVDAKGMVLRRFDGQANLVDAVQHALQQVSTL